MNGVARNRYGLARGPDRMGYRGSRCSAVWHYFVWVIRFWGICTAIGLWGVGVEIAYFGHALGYFLLFVAAVTSFLETVFLMNICVTLCVRDDQKKFIRVWEFILWIDNWRKGLLYAILGSLCFIQPHRLWLATISGSMTMVCSFLYFIKSFKIRRDTVAEERAKETYDRFEVPDDIEDGPIYCHDPSISDHNYDDSIQV